MAWSVSTEEMVHSEQNVYTEYAHSRRTEWITKIQPALKNTKLNTLVKACEKNYHESETSN
jgi:hypothetical protein